MELRMRSLGDGQWKENIPQAALTAFNLRAISKNYQSPQFGGQKLNQNAKFLPGSSSTGRYSLQII
jgi:hypothetical protein